MENQNEEPVQPHKAETGHTEGHSAVHPEVHRQPAKKGIPKIAIIILLLMLVVGTAFGIWYFLETQKYVYSDKAAVTVPLIQLTPKVPGILKEVFVDEGQKLVAHQSVARVGDDIISAEIPGIVAVLKKDIGAFYQVSQPVVTMYDPAEMRITASIDEDKGLNDIKVLDKVKFTVDAFGSEEFYGFVEEISSSKDAGDVVFSISDKRQVQKFDVKIRYDLARYPDFKNGMSAKVWIYK